MGSIRRTRSIHTENLEIPNARAGNKLLFKFIIIFIKFIYLLGELMLNQSSRTVSPILSLSPDVEVPVASGSAVAADQRSPSPTGKEEEPWIMFTRHRTHSDAQYEHTEVPY